MKKTWKIVAFNPALDEAPAYREYFIVRANDPQAAVLSLTTARSDLSNARCEVQGEASRDCLDWLEQNHRNVFSIMTLS
jgi:hypothetical protein